MNQAVAARRQHISEILVQGQKPNVPKLSKEFGVHPSTIYKDVRDIRATRVPIQEMTGRGGYPTAVSYNRWSSLIRTVDFTQVNYEFWNKLPRGKASGYEIGGLFAQPICKILTSAVFGEGVQFTVKSDTPRDPDNPHPLEAAINNEFVPQNRKLLADMFYAELTEGDSYAVVNPDTSITPVKPSQVELDTDALEWRKIGKVTINTKSDKSAITDSYTAEQREIKIKVNQITDGKGQIITPASENTYQFPNLIGVIPIVHFAYGREANELYGHPYYEALLNLFAQYDDIIQKSAAGVKAMGRPLPVITGITDTDAVLEANSTSTQRFKDNEGNWQERDVIDFDGLDIFLLGEGAQFDFKSPGNFTQDAGNILQYLFLLMLQHSRIPEWVWGGAVASSKASVDAQTPAWHDVIRGLRSDIEQALLEVVTIWWMMKALTDPSLTLAEGETLEIKWPELSGKDEKFEWQKALDTYDRGVLTNETLLTQAEIVADAQKEVEAAEEQAQAKQDEFEARLQKEADTESERITQFGRDDNEDMDAAA